MHSRAGEGGPAEHAARPATPPARHVRQVLGAFGVQCFVYSRLTEQPALAPCPPQTCRIGARCTGRPAGPQLQQGPAAACMPAPALRRTCHGHVILNPHPNTGKPPKGGVIWDVQPRLDSEDHPWRQPTQGGTRGCERQGWGGYHRTDVPGRPTSCTRCSTRLRCTPGTQWQQSRIIAGGISAGPKTFRMGETARVITYGMLPWRPGPAAGCPSSRKACTGEPPQHPPICVQSVHTARQHFTASPPGSNGRSWLMLLLSWVSSPSQ